VENGSIKISGKIVYQNIETGFWTLITDEKKIYRIVNIPDELKKDNLNIEAETIIDTNVVSVFMMGIPVTISDYKIINNSV